MSVRKGNRKRRYYELPRTAPTGKGAGAPGSGNGLSTITATGSAPKPSRVRSTAAGSHGIPTRLPALAVETFVSRQIAEALSDQPALASRLLSQGVAPAELGPALEAARSFADQLMQQGWQANRDALQRLIRKVAVDRDAVRIALEAEALLQILCGHAKEQPQTTSEEQEWSLTVPFDIAKAKRHGSTIITAGTEEPTPHPDPALVNALLRARRWFQTLVTGEARTITDLANKDGTNRAWISAQMPLAFLAPDIAASVIEGRQPPTITLRQLTAIAAQNTSWEDQRAALKTIAAQDNATIPLHRPHRATA
ncbi:MAG: hypothetical protein KDJ73_07400 [Notoacmeibacter sp.]|nr:hypothetical protein [Notoacmeibacter sp.]